MANNSTSAYTGESGVIKFSDDTSAVATIASVRNFTVDQETQAIESTVMGASGRSYLGGLTQFSGSADLYLIDGDDGQNSLFSAIGNNAAAIELYPSGTATGVKLSGDVIITGHSITSNHDGMVEASITFQGSGALTKADV
jgi:predicted secreted protein